MNHPNQPGYGGYGAPPRKGRGGLIALIVFGVLLLTGGGLYFTGVLDPLLKKIGVDMPAYEENGDYTARGLREAKQIIGGKRWADTGKCQTAWYEFDTDGTARAFDGTSGTWELQANGDFVLQDSRTAGVTTMSVRADYAVTDPNGIFVLSRKDAPSSEPGRTMEHCGPAGSGGAPAPGPAPSAQAPSAPAASAPAPAASANTGLIGRWCVGRGSTQFNADGSFADSMGGAGTWREVAAGQIHMTANGQTLAVNYRISGQYMAMTSHTGAVSEYTRC